MEDPTLDMDPSKDSDEKGSRETLPQISVTKLPQVSEVKVPQTSGVNLPPISEVMKKSTPTDSSLSFHFDRDPKTPETQKDEALKKEVPTAEEEDPEEEESEDSKEDPSNKEDESEDKTTTESPLLDDETVKIEIKPEGEDTATLPIGKKIKEGIDEDAIEMPKKRLPKFLFPLTRMRIAWRQSSNTCEFLMRAIAIIFSTLGWLFCVGGIPLISIAMIIVGSLYVDDCNIQPKIPTYLIVAGVLGTLQHFISIWTKYIPKESQGKLQVYRAYCQVLDKTLQLFLTIWFVLGCIWVYGAHSLVVFKDKEKDEYCDQTLYLFAFWMLNLSFIFLGLLTVCSLCCILAIVTIKDKKDTSDEEKGVVQ